MTTLIIHKPVSDFMTDTVSIRATLGEHRFTATERNYDDAHRDILKQVERHLAENAPKITRITPEYLKSEIKDVEYTRLTDTLTHCAITVHNGFVFTGESACVDASNYDAEIGNKIAYGNAFDSMWKPYGFALKQEMFKGDK